MLDLTCRRAGLADGQRISSSVRLGIALAVHGRRFPASRFVGVSNSRSQRALIEARAAARGLTTSRS